MAVRKRCIKTIFSRTILCAGTMTDYVMIKKRELEGSGVNETTINEGFTDIAQYMGYVEDRLPVKRFDGVSISDEITHIIYIPYEQAVYELDRGSLFVDFECTRNRRFTLLAINPYQEDYIALYCRETGFSDLEAANG